MRVVVLSSCDVVSLPVVLGLHERVDAEIVHVRSPAPEPARRIGREVATSGLPMKENPLYRQVRRQVYGSAERRLDRAVRRSLFGRERVPQLPSHVCVRKADVNEHPDLISRLRPDILVLNSAPIVGEELLRVPRVATFNLHLGITPEYRGNNTIFQAMLRRDWDRVGLTVHHVDAGVDTGPVLAQAYPPLERDDTEATILAKCARLGTDVLVELIEASTAGAPEGRRQDGAGTTYRWRDRHLKDDAALSIRWLGGDRAPRRAERVERFFAPRPLGRLIDVAAAEQRVASS